MSVKTITRHNPENHMNPKLPAQQFYTDEPQRVTDDALEDPRKRNAELKAKLLAAVELLASGDAKEQA